MLRPTMTNNKIHSSESKSNLSKNQISLKYTIQIKTNAIDKSESHALHPTHDVTKKTTVSNIIKGPTPLDQFRHPYF